jgi:uncharacterized protein YjeT (DUF2065 family)
VKVDFLFLVIGVILIIEGIPYTLFPGKMKNLHTWIEMTDVRWLRLFGLIALMIGIVLVIIFKSRI